MKREQNAVILIAASTWFPISARMAMAFLRHGCSVSAVCPTGHPLALVPGIGRLYPYRGWRSLHSLHQAILAAKPDLVVPCDDGVTSQLHALHATQPALRPLIERSLGDPAFYAILDSRDQLLEASIGLGIRVPATRAIKSLSDLDTWSHTPTALKTDGSTGGNGVAIVDTPSAVRSSFLDLNKPLTAATALKRFFVNRNPLALWMWRAHPQPNVIAQEFIPGTPANTLIACWQGEVLASVTVETLCSQGSTGAATIVRFLNHPEIQEASHKLASHFKLSGLYGLDFILEQQKDTSLPAAHLIELNPRCTQLGHLNLPGQGDLAGILAAKSTGTTVTPSAISSPIEGDTVAFYPQALAWNPQNPYITNGYHDIPSQAPALIAELLLAEWPYRQWPARLYHHFFPPRTPQQANFDNAVDSTQNQASQLNSL